MYLCTMIGNLSGVPVRLYEEEKPVYFHSLVALPKDPFQLVREKSFPSPTVWVFM